MPAGTYRAFTLGHESELALVRVNGQLVAPGRLTPVESAGPPKLEYVAGSRRGGTICHVVGYEGCDPLVPLGPRPPRPYERQWNATDAAAQRGAGDPALVVPFAGRRAAGLYLALTGASGDDTLEYTVYGRRYVAAAALVNALAVGGGIGSVDEGFLERPILGTKAAPLTATYQASPGGGIALGVAKALGGTDSYESWDELLVFAEVKDGGNTTADRGLVACVHVLGEEGLG
jgi:hypothetical protein